VVIFRPITGGAFLEGQQKLYPRDRCWDVLAKKIDVDMIRFEDVPSMLKYESPDFSHLDRRDASRFTLDFAAELERRGILKRYR
jgi:hypothetical protein